MKSVTFKELFKLVPSKKELKKEKIKQDFLQKKKSYEDSLTKEQLKLYKYALSLCSSGKEIFRPFTFSLIGENWTLTFPKEFNLIKDQDVLENFADIILKVSSISKQCNSKIKIKKY